MDADGWHRVDPVDVPAEGRVRSVTVDGRTVALARCGGRLGALENRCPHQGGPLGEGSAAPGRPIVAVTGDGGFGQYAAELTTAVKYGIPVKHVLFDNHSLGKIGKEQIAADGPALLHVEQDPELL